jgi:hypothetical protein
MRFGEGASGFGPVKFMGYVVAVVLALDVMAVFAFLQAIA